MSDACDTCGREVRWHRVGHCWVHVGGSSWCFPERSGYDQPKATLHGRTGRESWGE